MRRPFSEQVIGVVRMIPAGKTMTYREVARGAGRPRAYRAVGNILNRIWQTNRGQTIPCHRVIRSDGRAGGYAGGVVQKIKLLKQEQKTNEN